MTLKYLFYRNLYRFARKNYRKHLNATYLNELRTMYSGGLKLTDHAIARYYERIEGKDPQELADRITTGLKARVIAEGDGKYVIDGMRVTVVGNLIKTIDGTTDPTNFKSKIVSNGIRGLTNLANLKRVTDKQLGVTTPSPTNGQLNDFVASLKRVKK